MPQGPSSGERVGRYIQQAQGYRAFIPAALPPDPPLHLTGELLALLSEADRALGRLDGVTSVLPNPDLFVAMYVRHEAVLSSQIEGTQSTLEDVLEYEMDEIGPKATKDAAEVVNYVQAMNRGLGRLETLPLSLRLLREIHAELMRGVRGGERNPGEFRTTQNWIGPQNCTLRTASFVPPPPHEMGLALDNLERFLHDRDSLPTLIQCGLAHAQFETIHPFLDGNGRVGRLLITLLLCERKILERPLLYLSIYLKAHRAEYYDRLMAVRLSGDWEGWLRFFLRGIAQVSVAATQTARDILKLREETRHKLSSNALGGQLVDYLFEKPVLSVRAAARHLDCSYVTAAKLIEELERQGFLRETTGQKRNRLYRYEPYLALFDSHGMQARQPMESLQHSQSES